MLLGAVMAIAIPSLGLVGHQRRAAERRQQAMLEVENLMERFTATGWNGVSAESAAQLKLAADVERQLPGAALQCTVTAQSSPLEAKRIQIELTWSNRAGESVAPVRLTTWVYRTGRTQ
jgi:hypothetical protein